LGQRGTGVQPWSLPNSPAPPPPPPPPPPPLPPFTHTSLRGASPGCRPGRLPSRCCRHLRTRELHTGLSPDKFALCSPRTGHPGQPVPAKLERKKNWKAVCPVAGTPTGQIRTVLPTPAHAWSGGWWRRAGLGPCICFARPCPCPLAPVPPASSWMHSSHVQNESTRAPMQPCTTHFWWHPCTRATLTWHGQSCQGPRPTAHEGSQLGSWVWLLNPCA
jgi:hypothetical protein